MIPVPALVTSPVAVGPETFLIPVDTIEGLHPSAIGTAHGPVLAGDAIHDAFDRVRSLAGRPRVVPPSQSLLDEILAATTAAAA